MKVGTAVRTRLRARIDRAKAAKAASEIQLHMPTLVGKTERYRSPPPGFSPVRAPGVLRRKACVWGSTGGRDELAAAVKLGWGAGGSSLPFGNRETVQPRIPSWCAKKKGRIGVRSADRARVTILFFDIFCSCVVNVRCLLSDAFGPNRGKN